MVTPTVQHCLPRFLLQFFVLANGHLAVLAAGHQLANFIGLCEGKAVDDDVDRMQVPAQQAFH